MKQTLMNQKKTIAALLIMIVVGISGFVVWQQFYQPEDVNPGSVSIIDDRGKNVTLTKYPPQRIVSLVPSCTEILFALGLGDKVVGVDETSDYPPEVLERVKAGNLTTVGKYSLINVELVLRLEPDLILASGAKVQGSIVESLESLGQPVVVVYPQRLDDVFSNILLIGKATGHMEQAEAVVADLQKRFQEVANKTRDSPNRPRVYAEYYFNGGFASYGSESFLNELIYMAGGVNVFTGFAGTYVTTSTEEVLKANPEIMIIAKGKMSMLCGLTPEIIKNRSGWNEIYAVQHNQIYEIGDDLLNSKGPRLATGLLELAKAIHPEIFS